jgi:hypothetical protein
MKKTIFIVSIILIVVSQAYAEDIYFAQTSAGANNGTSCSNAKALSTITWGTSSGQIGPNDTAHLCGTLTSTFTIGASGTDGNPVTIFFEPNAKFSAPTWSSWIIRSVARSYVVIDGGTNGIIEATDNGTNLTYQNYDTIGISFTSSSDFEIKNLTMQNFFIFDTGTAAGQPSRGGIGVLQDTDEGTSSNVRIHGNTFKWINKAWYAVFGQNGGSNSRFYNNTLIYVDASIFAGLYGSKYTGVYFYDNTVGDAGVWDSSDNMNHHEVLHFFAYPSGQLETLRFYNNHIYGDWGSYTTCAGPYFEDMTFTDIVIYNNLFAVSGWRAIYNKTQSAMIVANNTNVGGGYAYFVDCNGGGNVTSRNNIILAEAGNNCTGTSSNNIYAGTDPHFVAPSSLITGDFHLTNSSTAAIDQGTTTGLTSYYTTDKDGNTRSVPWDIGAYEYGSGSTPATPKHLRIITVD